MNRMSTRTDIRIITVKCTGRATSTGPIDDGEGVTGGIGAGGENVVTFDMLPPLDSPSVLLGLLCPESISSAETPAPIRNTSAESKDECTIIPS